MYLNRRTLLGLALGSSVAGVVRAERPSPDSDVPVGHWSRDALTWFLHYDLEFDYPTGTISGLYAFTRQRVAELTANIAEAVEWWAQRGWPESPRSKRAWPHGDPLTLLAREFEPELRLIGAWTGAFRASMAHFALAIRDGCPQGIRVPLVHPNRAYDPSFRERGRKQAQDAWLSGMPYLLVNHPPLDSGEVIARAVPMRYAPVPEGDFSGIQEIAGHNEEIWRLLRERGLPRDHAVSWASNLFDLERAWDAKSPRVMLNERFPGVGIPGSERRLLWSAAGREKIEAREQFSVRGDGRLERARHQRLVRLGLLLLGRRGAIRKVEVPDDRIVAGRLELQWGPAASGVAYVRVGVDDPEKPHRLYAVELRTGGLLGAAAVD